ncbi:Ff.00g023100.m01.CDS01 [Fusarium sp. VM40]|nr:Ff.00g023100.m01.CDS01 [Fusarium sp. VM40]
MCKWDVFQFKCDCVTVLLKEHCHQHRLKQTADCNAIQQLREEWVYPQDGVCKDCVGREVQCANGPFLKWPDIHKRIYDEAKSLANMGRFPQEL